MAEYEQESEVLEPDSEPIVSCPPPPALDHYLALLHVRISHLAVPVLYTCHSNRERPAGKWSNGGN